MSAVLDAARSSLLFAVPAPASGSAPDPLIPNPRSGLGFDAATVSAELPGGGPFAVQGVGPGAGAPFAAASCSPYIFEIELEGGPAGFAGTVDSALRNPKSFHNRVLGTDCSITLGITAVCPQNASGAPGRGEGWGTFW